MFVTDESMTNYRSLFILSLSYVLCKYAQTHHFTQLLDLV